MQLDQLVVYIQLTLFANPKLYTVLHAVCYFMLTALTSHKIREK